ERAAAAELRTPAVDFGFEVTQAGHRTGNGVLRTAQIIVDDLQELAGRFCHLLDKRTYFGVVESDLRWADSGQTVIRTPAFIAGHQRMHHRTAAKHDLDDGLQRDDARDGAQRVVFADRMTREHGALLGAVAAVDERAGLA